MKLQDTLITKILKQYLLTFSNKSYSIKIFTYKIKKLSLTLIFYVLVPIGKAKILREGTDVTITAFSIMVGRALQAADALAAQGISAEVIDLRTIRPLDSETIVASVKKTSRLVTCEEGFPFAGVGAEIAIQVMEQAFDWLDAPIARVTGKDVPMPYAENLEKLALPQVEDIVATAQSVCDGFRGYHRCSFHPSAFSVSQGFEDLEYFL